ncbi:hypothetical protein [Scytonema sp. PCC 10023]|uniref:hypothetical protein n=1 Tax=Scytonema sp. PCC 10023 TaxID=1680591 RepID=UPI0039C74877
MPPVPPYLIFFTLVLVVLPSITVIFLRLALYRHLVEEADKVKMLIDGNKSVTEPPIIKILKSRFQEASSRLDHVNTAALIEQVYSQKNLKFNLIIFTKQIGCEQIDYFCRILPNLLLAFGLLGTFLGITMNLSALSQTINQTTASNVNSLVAELEKPLQGMSIAFTTSLMGILFSALLTVFNWSKNTSLAKFRLISSLEDYLDNIYQPTIDGHTRLDKAVDRMASLQNDFLTNFGNNVRDVVEKSLGKVAKEIAEENKRANELARQVYESFTQSSGTISAAATEFKFASEELKEKAEIFKQAAEIFDNSQFPQRLSEATGDLASTQERFSQSAASLAETVISIATAVNEVQRCSQELIKLGEEIKSVNQTSVSVLELHQSNQTSLGNIIPQLKQGANSFSKAINRLDNLEQIIVNKADSLNELVETVVTYTEQVNSAIESLIGTNNQKVETVIDKFEGYANQLNVKIDTFKLDLMQLIKDNDIKVISEYKKMGDRLLGGLEETTEYNIKSYQFLIDKLIQQASEIKQEIFQLRKAQINDNYNKNDN